MVSRTLQWSLAGVGVALVIVALAWQAWMLAGIRSGNFLDDRKLKLVVAAVKSTDVGLEQIAAMHLFGNAAEKPVAPPQPAELPKTDLKLVLVGAITDSDPKQASALINAENATKRYFVGDNIPGGALLHEVLYDSVVLKRENRYETLEFMKGGEITPQAKANLKSLGITMEPISAPGSNAAPSSPTSKAPGMSAPPVKPGSPGNVQQQQGKKGASLRDRFKH